MEMWHRTREMQQQQEGYLKSKQERVSVNNCENLFFYSDILNMLRCWFFKQIDIFEKIDDDYDNDDDGNDGNDNDNSL